MAKYVKVSTVCAATIGSNSLTGQEAVDRMVEHWTAKLQRVLVEKPDLIVLPEACDRYSDLTGDDRRDFYAVRGTQVRDMMMKTAREHKCYIAYSATRQVEDGSWRNSTQLIDRNGEIAGIYNKNHLVIEENTESGILYGKDAPVFECDFGTVACVICFDLNFDELRLKYAAKQTDIILFSSMYHGGLMQQYWAYSCRSFFVGALCNLPGAVIAPNGRTLAETTNYFDHVTTTINLDSKLIHLSHNWQKIEQLKTTYSSGFSMDDTGHLGAVLIASETAEVTIDEMIAEVGIETLDDYMQRSLDHRHTPGNMEK
ncbi:MAG: carbon-nitrogen hydrolase family protein [Victivallaceae bacterium]|nr:carbon-nitrogen hydrolase family protein [Victivallaceae bacterium]